MLLSLIERSFSKCSWPHKKTKLRLALSLSLLRGSRQNLPVPAAKALYSECPKFHPNRLTSSGVIAERENTVETRHKVNPILGEASLSPSKKALCRIMQQWCLERRENMSRELGIRNRKKIPSYMLLWSVNCKCPQVLQRVRAGMNIIVGEAPYPYNSVHPKKKIPGWIFAVKGRLTEEFDRQKSAGTNFPCHYTSASGDIFTWETLYCDNGIVITYK